MNENPIRYAYLNWEKNLFVRPEIRVSELGQIWGLFVQGGTYWCRWHTNMFKFGELEKWRTNRVLNLRDMERKGSSYERCRATYFLEVAGSSEIQYGIPTVEDFERVLPLMSEFSEALRTLESKGVVVQDWSLDEGYWACDAKNRLVVFDLKKGKVIPCDPDQLYELRPIWTKNKK